MIPHGHRERKRKRGAGEVEGEKETLPCFDLFHFPNIIHFCISDDIIIFFYTQDTLSRGLGSTITKRGWLFKGPESGKDNVISFTRVCEARLISRC